MSKLLRNVIIFALTIFSTNLNNAQSPAFNLKAGDTIYSPNKMYALTMQQDSNLCIYKNNTEFLWCTMSHGYGSNGVAKLKDGRMIIEDANGNEVWALEGITTAKTVTIGNEGVLKVLDAKGTELWSGKQFNAFELEGAFSIGGENDCNVVTEGVEIIIAPMSDTTFDLITYEGDTEQTSNCYIESTRIVMQPVTDEGGLETSGYGYLLTNGNIKMHMQIKKDSLNQSCNFDLVRYIYDESEDNTADSSQEALNDSSEPTTPKITEEATKQISDYAKVIKFDHARYSITEDTNYILHSIARIMKEYPESKFVIEAHTSKVGSERTNQRLSEMRAQEVYNQLVYNGVDISRIKYQGYGESQPITSNKSSGNQVLNERIEIKLVE